jgi:hypothetical protein
VGRRDNRPLTTPTTTLALSLFASAGKREWGGETITPHPSQPLSPTLPPHPSPSFPSPSPLPPPPSPSQSRRGEDFRIIVMSATLDAGKFVSYLRSSNAKAAFIQV